MDFAPVVMLLVVGFPSVLAVIDQQRFQDVVWRRSGRSLLLWTLVAVFPIVGPAMWLLVGRPKLVVVLRRG